MTYATVDPAWTPAPTPAPDGKRLRDVDLGRCHLVVEETSPGIGIIVSMYSTEPADYLVSAFLPGASVLLPPSP
jgi:hypothetical protein